jgi:hypothetical protein
MPESKSLLVLFFRKEQNLLFLKKKKQKDFYFPAASSYPARAGNSPRVETQKVFWVRRSSEKSRLTQDGIVRRDR